MVYTFFFLFVVRKAIGKKTNLIEAQRKIAVVWSCASLYDCINDWMQASPLPCRYSLARQGLLPPQKNPHRAQEMCMRQIY